MNILIIMPWIKLGGAELIAVKTAVQLEKRGHRMRLAALFADLDGWGDEARRVDYRCCPAWLAGWFRRYRWLTLFAGPWWLAYLIWRQAGWADVLFPQSLPAYWLTPLPAKVYGRKTIWLCNEPPRRRRWSDSTWLEYLMWRVADSGLERRLARLADKIVVYSKMIGGEVKERYGRKAAVVRLGVDFNFFSQRKDSLAVLAHKYKVKGKKIILMVGKLHPQKNQRLGLEVLADLLRIESKIRLVLVGEGPDEGWLKRRAAELGLDGKVIFAGFASAGEVRSWYRLCELVLYPSIGQTAKTDQSWGFVPFEALCQKKISLVSAGCGAAEVLGREKIGLVCPPEKGLLVRQIADVLDPGRRKYYQRMGVRGYNYVKENMRWENWGKQLDRLIGRI